MIEKIRFDKWKSSYGDLLRRLKKREPFAFLRLCDGEFMALDGQIGTYISGAQLCIDKEAQKMMFEVVRSFPNDPNFLLGICNLSVRTQAHIIAKLRFPPRISLIPAQILHLAHQERIFYKFYNEILNYRSRILVGPSYLARLADLYTAFVEVPYQNCHLQRERIFESRYAHLLTNLSSLILLSCSILAKWLITELYPLFRKATYLDTGAAFDPLLGRKSRKYMVNL